MEQKCDQFGAFFGKRVQMPLKALRRAIWEPKWGQVGSSWGSEQMSNRCKSRNATIRTRAVGTRHVLYMQPCTSRRKRTRASRSCSHRFMLEPFWRFLTVLRGSLGVVVVSDAFRKHFESHLGAKMEPKSAFFGSP